LIVTNDYPDFLEYLYGENAGLKRERYAEQLRVRNRSLFGGADFQSKSLRSLGHEAWDVYVNNTWMQTAWLQENAETDNPEHHSDLRQELHASLRSLGARHLRGRRVHSAAAFLSRRIVGPRPETYAILRQQIKFYRPDVLIVQAVDTVDVSFLWEMKGELQSLVGYHAAAPLNMQVDYGCYDLIISSFPPTVDLFRSLGLRASYVPLAFEPAVLELTPSPSRSIEVSFVGSFGMLHGSRTEFLERVAGEVPELCIWGPSLHGVPRKSPLHGAYRGPAWGASMYEILRTSRIVLNHHGDVPPYANNSRLYEATGCGALLLTDWKMNLRDLFEPGEEVAAYRDSDDCIGSISYFLENEEERQAVATAGHAKTMTEHTTVHRQRRMLELLDEL
jgi:hypothetical protein